MKFFDQGNPLLIDIERSLKIENIELLFTFVKVIYSLNISIIYHIIKDESSSIYFGSTFYCLLKILKR
jgi:hypothetical protein